MIRVFTREPFENRAIDFLGIPEDDLLRECLYREDIDQSLKICQPKRPGSFARTGFVHSPQVPRNGPWPRSLRTVVYVGRDPGIDWITGVGLAAHFGVQSGTGKEGHGLFSRLKFGLLGGIQIDAMIDFSKENDEQKRTYLAVRPEVRFRVEHAKVFELTDGVYYDLSRGTSIDLSAGLVFDTLERRGVSFALTFRPLSNNIGLYARWDRFFDGLGDSIVGGVEFTDEAVAIPASTAVLATAVAGVILLVNGVYECLGDPDCDGQ